MDDKDWLEEHTSKDIEWHEIQKSAPTNHLVPDSENQPPVDPAESIPQFSSPTQHLIPSSPPDTSKE